MKRCPQCYQVYANTETFCEADGQLLLADPAPVVNRADLVPDRPVRQPNQAVLATGIIGVLTGVILCAGVYAAYMFLGSPSNRDDRERPPLAAQVHEAAPARPAPARVAEAVPSPSETPTEEEEAEASPEPSQPIQVEPVSARLNRGPVSTGDQTSANTDTKTIIEMQDGSVVGVDAAWKDNQGVWYRRGGLVSFVEGPRVKSITARAEPKASPANQ